MDPWKATANVHHNLHVWVPHTLLKLLYTFKNTPPTCKTLTSCPERGIVRFHPAAAYISWCRESSSSCPDKIPDVSSSDLL